MEQAALSISIIALVLTAAGWIVAYWLNDRTQKQILINTLLNEARNDLITTLREFHQWCIDLHSYSIGMKVDDITSAGQHSRYHDERKQKLTAFTWDDRRLDCFRRLEEYETLFPGTATVRVEILEMVNSVCEESKKLADQHQPGRPPSDEALDDFRRVVFDVLSLAHDLMIYIQNFSIGQITGNKVPERKPLVPNSIRLVSDKKGGLKMVR
jgi:hypothetical protein